MRGVLARSTNGIPRNRNGLARDLCKGALAGAAGWWAMDQALSFLYDHEGPSARKREDAARGGVAALEVIAEETAERAGVAISNEQRQAAGTGLQWVVGIGAGVTYGALRGRVPGMHWGRGLAYGAGLWLLVDEGMNPALGVTPGPLAYPWQTHARGLVGHLVFGLTAETMLQLTD